ncbi:MAG: UbiA family prenyltransferase [Cyclobacteriaceae bacterium]
MKKSTILHLRIPFSFFLLPVFLFSCAVAESVNWFNFWLVFFILHVLIYPASNGFNSYFDKDEKSIGGLKNPPPVSKELYWVSLLFDFTGLVLGLLVSLEFTIMIFVYGLVSKAYSHPLVRLKKYPVSGWLAAGIFQGYFTWLMCYIALTETLIMETLSWSIHLPGLLSSVLLLGSYPMTQIYQHEEDGSRGDLTLSRMLGIKGTFHFTALMFSLSMGGFAYFFLTNYSVNVLLLFALFLSPVLIYFGMWYLRILKDESAADFASTMRLNFISAFFLNAFFLTWWLF